MSSRTQGLLKVAAALLLTAVLVLGFQQHWNPLLLVLIGAVWAIVAGGFVVAPLLSYLLADVLSQFGGRKILPAEEAREERDEWDQDRKLPTETPPFGLHLKPTAGPAVRPAMESSSGGFDWNGFVAEVAFRLEAALGDGFAAEANGSNLVLSFANQARRVSLGSIFQPPPLDITERAQRGCLKMMDEAQMFAMRVRHGPWPAREDEVAAGVLARPQVRFDEGEIRMSWSDSSGVVMRLRPLVLGFSSPGQETPGW